MGVASSLSGNLVELLTQQSSVLIWPVIFIFLVGTFAEIPLTPALQGGGRFEETQATNIRNRNIAFGIEVVILLTLAYRFSRHRRAIEDSLTYALLCNQTCYWRCLSGKPVVLIF